MSITDIAQILGNLAEFIGSIVIVVTLIYLAIQIRQNSEQLAAQSRYNNYKGRTDLTLTLALNNEMFDAYFKSISNTEMFDTYFKSTSNELSPAEQTRIAFYMRAVFTFWEYEFREYEAGCLAEEELNPIGKRSLFEGLPDLWGPGWAAYKPSAARAFADYIDKNIAMTARAD